MPESVSPALPRSTPATSPQARLHTAAQGFEAMMLRQMLAAARNANPGGGLFDSDEAKQVAQMRDEALADTLSRTGQLGVARLIERQVASQAGIAARTASESHP